MKEVGGAASDMEEGFDKLRSATRAALKKRRGRERRQIRGGQRLSVWQKHV